MYFKLLVIFCFVIGGKCGSKNAECKVSRTCKTTKFETLTEPMRKYILHEHNKIRGIASSYIHNNIPVATDLDNLDYSQELEVVANCCAKSCAEQYYTQIYDNVTYGTNRYYWNTPHDSVRDVFKEAIYLWTHNKFSVLTKEIIETFLSDSDHNHITQILWSRTREIGCTSMEYDEDIGVVCCAYYPRGNLEGEGVYNVKCVGDHCHLSMTNDSKIFKLNYVLFLFILFVNYKF